MLRQQSLHSENVHQHYHQKVLTLDPNHL